MSTNIDSRVYWFVPAGDKLALYVQGETASGAMYQGAYSSRESAMRRKGHLSTATEIEPPASFDVLPAQVGSLRLFAKEVSA